MAVIDQIILLQDVDNKLFEIKVLNVTGNLAWSISVGER